MNLNFFVALLFVAIIVGLATFHHQIFEHIEAPVTANYPRQ